MSSEEHDILIRVDTNIKNLMSRIDKHVEDDAKFHEKIEVRVKMVERIVFLGLGGLAVIQFWISNWK